MKGIRNIKEKQKPQCFEKYLTENFIVKYIFNKEWRLNKHTEHPKKKNPKMYTHFFPNSSIDFFFYF